MGYLLKKSGKIAIEKETTEGVYQGNPAATSFIKANSENVVIGKSKEELTRELLGDGIGASASEQGLTTATGSITMPLACASTEGGLSPMGLSLESLLGSAKTVATINCTSTTASTLTAPGHTYVKGDIVVVKEAGAFEARPIASVLGDVITLAFALSSDPSDTVAIAGIRIYSCADEGHPSLSITQFLGDAGADTIAKLMSGAKCIGASFDNFVTGQLGEIAFTYEGLEMNRVNQAPTTPVYTQVNSTKIKGGLIFQNGAVFKINELGLAIQNTVSAISNTKEGKVALKVIKREVTGKFNPYLVTGAAGLAQYQIFDSNAPFSLFVSHSNPTAVAGENENFICLYLPVCRMTTIEDGDYNSIITDNVAFKANVGSDTKEIYIGIA